MTTQGGGPAKAPSPPNCGGSNTEFANTCFPIMSRRAGHGDWRRVTRAEPCPICSHDSWCTVAPSGGAVRCKRTESAHPVTGEDGAAWLHVFDDRLPPTAPHRRCRVVAARDVADLRTLAEQWQRDLGPERLRVFAASMGITSEALLQIGCGWSGTAYSFPMFDAKNRVVGIRLRCPRTGRKFAHVGGKDGVFLSTSTQSGMLMLPEGATDTAVCVQLGFAVVGRPSCSGGTRIVAELAKARHVAILADRDEPGRRGAESLAAAILPYVASLRTATPPPPHKDLRDWFNAGATSEVVRNHIEAQEPRHIVLRVKVMP